MSSNARTELVIDALGMAISKRSVSSTVLHSDHGVQYTSLAYSQKLQEAGLTCSMGGVGCAFDDAMMEGFFATLQTELLDRHSWQSRAELRCAIFRFIEVFYNRNRVHSSLGYLSPQNYESRYTRSEVTG